MKRVMDYVIGGIIALLVLFSLAPSVFEQFASIEFADAPQGVEEAVGAVLVIFFVLVLYKLYNDAA